MISLSHALIMASILFTLGLVGILIRKNLLFILLGLEIMLNSVAMIFIIASSYWNNTDGQIMYILIITLAATEASIGLALLLRLHYHHYNLDISQVNELHR